MSRKRKNNGECAYCGIISELTRDEVLPRCLFSKPRPDNLIKVLACARCNNEEKSRDDDFLRDLILSDRNSMKNETAKNLFDTKALSSINKNKSFFARQTAPTTKRIPEYSEAGIYLGEVYQIRVNGDRVHKIFSRIVTTLYYWKTHQRIPPNCEFSIEQVKPKNLDEVKKLFNNTELYEFYEHKCRNEFKLIMIYNQDKDNYVAMFWLIFYEYVCWFVGVEQAKK